ncbi:MAG: OmpA family protein [Chitinivibrionales bacterium]
MKKISLLVLVVIMLTSLGFASVDTAQKNDTLKQKNDTSSSITVPVPAGSSEAVRLALLDLRSELKSAFQVNTPHDLNAINSYLTALAQIEEAHQFFLENFTKAGSKQNNSPMTGKSSKEKNALSMYEACSLYTVIALIQINKNKLDDNILQASHRSDSIHTELSKVYESIINLERGRASELKGKLEDENAKALALQQEADRRFKELQSELIKVRKDVRGTIISMSDLLFAFDKADLTNDLKTALAKIAGILSVYKKFHVAVEGHTDNIGTAEYNKDLSGRRANNVKDFLIAQGVEATRLSSIGYGFTKPIASNKTKDGRQKNRRVDLVVMDKK